MERASRARNWIVSYGHFHIPHHLRLKPKNESITDLVGLNDSFRTYKRVNIPPSRISYNWLSRNTSHQKGVQELTLVLPTIAKKDTLPKPSGKFDRWML